MPATLLKTELDWYSCPANFTKYFRKAFSIENFLRLLLLLIFFEAKQSGTKKKKKKMDRKIIWAGRKGVKLSEIKR